eukprot:TRINITY_DN5204_c0_g1_i1.p1 TRINITY_DN5204_c0_g1~~TRINITY_DN5204_c0_g1_i1.p1  ORF type:complete len:776 (-),score=139.31 TRINITY_DN5204_c0_g1_i1:131-2458(-)
MSVGRLWAPVESLRRRTVENLGQIGSAIQETTTRACGACGQSVLRARTFDCSECGLPCCLGCRAVESRGFRVQSQVCCACAPSVRERRRSECVDERMKRVDAFLEGHLEPYRYSPESKLDMTLRLSGHVFHGLKQVTGFLPLGKAASAVKAGYYLVRYGPLILAGDDILEAFQLIVGLAKTVDPAGKSQIFSPLFFGGLYYMMGEHCGERGRSPTLEVAEHMAPCGSVPKPEHEQLLHLRRMLRLLYVAKEPTPTDAARLLRQVWPGAELVLAELSSAVATPSYALLCSRAERAAYLVLPGTRNPADLATDFNAGEDSIDGGTGHCGMVRSSRWLEGEVAPVLIRLHKEGFTVSVIGHSLGAGVGAIFTSALRHQIESVRCVGFGMPACVTESCLPAFHDCVVAVVNRDDMVPRLSVRSVEAIVNSALCPGQLAKTQAWMTEDWQAVKDLERVIELRRRSAPQAANHGSPSAAAPTAAATCGSGGSAATSEALVEDREAKVLMLMEAGVERNVAERALDREDGDLSRALLRATDEEMSEVGDSPQRTDREHDVDVDAEDPARPQNTAVLSRNQGTNASSLLGGLQRFSLSSLLPAKRRAEGSPIASPERPAAVAALPSAPVDAALPETAADGAQRRHPHFVIPGQLIHLYRQNGLGRAALSAADADTFARIILCTDMLNDHKLSAYDEALEQSCIEEPTAPPWESFDERTVCACCEADFNWAYILHSETQRMLARHHCCACGRVVCDGCSRRRHAHPHLGFTMPVRTCDRCFFQR